ncbi:MAG: phospho-N-acetylmuramoyl-pentapeptide-transferase [Planctomycetes bacterium]|nr:phospho-N-acetylmuramoyl-pentapeptide-transferase [Planctomycetota bacterium]
MLLWILHNLAIFSTDALTACGKITPRAALAAGVSFLAAVLLGPRWIAWLNGRFREPIKSDSPDIARLHRGKQSTPTMGGLFVVAAMLVAVLLFGDLNNIYLWPTLFAVVGLTLVGIVDDTVKIRSEKKGISARWKLAAQLAVAAVSAVWLYHLQASVHDGLLLHVPLAGTPISLGWWFVPLAVLAIVGSSNAVNLADGLDGLAGGCLLAAAAAMTGLVYAAGHAEWAAYLGVPRIPQAGEMTVLAGAMIGGVLGFLWFNCHPAQVFLGNTGSLPLGGLLGVLAVIARQELLLVVIAGVFVVEALSVIVQVGYFKWRRRRLLRCAPLHHHFQLLGWAENKIVVRFWIAAALCALLGTASLKLGTSDGPPKVAETIGKEAPNHPAGKCVFQEPRMARTAANQRDY